MILELSMVKTCQPKLKLFLKKNPGIIAMPYWKNHYSTGFVNSHGDLDITAAQQSEIVSILSAGTFFGALTAAPFGDLLGRRLGLVASCFVFMFGVILQTASTAIPMFVAGRFFAGFGVGLVSALSESCSLLGF
jgi:SP family sugar:H+ symporter-like MFS transporter